MIPGGVSGSDDRALPFQVEGLDVRGRVVTLGPSLDAILQRHDFPAPVKRLVGEAAVLASLLATSLKDIGRFILQTQTDGPVSHDRRRRAHARPDPRDRDLRRGGGRAKRRPTAACDPGRAARPRHARHDRRAGPDAAALSGLRAARGRRRSRRRRTPISASRSRSRPASAWRSPRCTTATREGAARRTWRAGGIIGQFLPVSEDRVRRRDLPGRRCAGGTRALGRRRRTTTPGSRRRR